MDWWLIAIPPTYLILRHLGASPTWYQPTAVQSRLKLREDRSAGGLSGHYCGLGWLESFQVKVTGKQHDDTLTFGKKVRCLSCSWDMIPKCIYHSWYSLGQWKSSLVIYISFRKFGNIKWKKIWEIYDSFSLGGPVLGFWMTSQRESCF